MLLRNNGFHPNPVALFGFWTMRPRASVATLSYFLFAACAAYPVHENPYLWSLKDHVVEDTLLNLLSLPWAVYYVVKRPSQLNDPVCKSNTAYIIFWDSFYAITGVGAVSAIVLVVMLVHAYSKDRRGRAQSHYALAKLSKTSGASRWYEDAAHDSQAPERVSAWWKFVLFVASTNMVAAFAANWVIWSSKSFPSPSLPFPCPSSLSVPGPHFTDFASLSIRYQRRHQLLSRQCPWRGNYMGSGAAGKRTDKADTWWACRLRMLRVYALVLI